MILVLLHASVGGLVVLSNLAVALWLGLRNWSGQPLDTVGEGLLWVARLSLALQLLFGLALVAQGYVGQSLHYLGAIGAAVVAWLASQRARREPRASRSLVWGHLAVAVLALLTYIVAIEG